MNQSTTESAAAIARLNSATLLTAVLLLGTLLAVHVADAANGALATAAWFDVAVVQVLSALPLAWWLGAWSQTVRPVIRTVLILAFVLPAPLLLAFGAATSPGDWLAESLSASILVISTAAAAIMLLSATRKSGPPVPFSRFTFTSLLLTALVTPATLLHARIRNEQDRVAGLLDQSRFGEALEAIQPLDRVAPDRKINGRTVREITTTLAKGVGQLQLQAALPLPENATEELLLSRAQALAILNQTDSALSVLRLCSEANPNRWLLEGTIRETRGDWGAGVIAYASARTALLKTSGSATSPGLEQAIRGIGYCNRKAGHIRDADAAYAELLERMPTAANHFLAAQFYEDAQESRLALDHARQAAALNPVAFAKPAESLMNRLQTQHFGCWGVYSSRSTSPR